MYKSEEGVFYERPNLFNGAKERKMVPAEDLHNVENRIDALIKKITCS